MTRTVRSLWEETIDFGTHLCRVERLEDRSGLLTIELTGVAVLHQQPVSITNGGLDPADVQDWKELCEGILGDPARWNGTFSRPGR
jgi:hypothetical protein